MSYKVLILKFNIIDIQNNRTINGGEEWIAAKIIRWSDGAINCYYAYLHKEHFCQEFDVLTGFLHDYTWIKESNGTIPECGIRTNTRFGGFGIGRGVVGDRLVVGKIVTINRLMYAPSYGLEHGLSTYEALAEIK